MQPVDFFFDPMCPWAYQTSRWIRTVREHTGLEITWRFFSLEAINRVDGKKWPWEREWSYGWSQMRIGAWLRREHGNDVVDQWYAAMGDAFHLRGIKTQDRVVHADLLDSIGLPRSIVETAIADATTHDLVRGDHDWVVNEHAAYGVPTIVRDGHALFGPVITPAPEGPAAMRLWQLVEGWWEFPHLYELRKPKTIDDWHHISDQFNPYLQARDWQTVANPVA
jgi:2-hydroxychromene-2-carboxylate isomerase